MDTMNSKKICFLINSVGGGGAEGVCINLANSLCDRGWQVTLVVLHLNNAVRLKELSKKVQLVVLGKNHARTAIVALGLFLREHKPGRILVFNHQLAVLLVILRAAFRFKTKIIARNINTLSQKKASETSVWHKHAVQGLIRLFYRKVDRIVAQSEGMANDLVCFYGIPEKKITVIHNPINSSIENHLQPQQVEKKNYLLCVGRLESQKAFHYAITAFSAIVPYYPELRLKIVGEGSLESELKKTASILKLTDRVDFEGYKENIVPYYLNAKATLLTSLYEGFPNVLVESIALGTPVVSFDCPSGPSEIVIDRVNGYLVNYMDAADLEVKINKVLLEDFDSFSVKSTASRFQSSIIIDQYESLII